MKCNILNKKLVLYLIIYLFTFSFLFLNNSSNTFARTWTAQMASKFVHDNGSTNWEVAYKFWYNNFGGSTNNIWFTYTNERSPDSIPALAPSHTFDWGTWIIYGPSFGPNSGRDPQYHIQWGTTCIDPKESSIYQNETGNPRNFLFGVSVTYPYSNSPTRPGGGGANNSGARIPYAYGNTISGRTDLCPFPCPRPSCDGRCGTFRNECGFGITSAQVSCGGCGANYCGTNAGSNNNRCNIMDPSCNSNNYCVASVASGGYNSTTCIGDNGCQCISGADCGPNACGTAWDNKCSWVANRCNLNNNAHRCYEDTINNRDSRCVASNGTTGDVCFNNSHCNQTTHYCRSLSSGPCGTCRPYDEIVGRVFVDRNWDRPANNPPPGRNEWNAEIDEGISGESVQRRKWDISTWQSTRTTTTNPSGGFKWDASDPYSERLRDIANQDVRIISGDYDTSCLYRDIIRSRYGALNTVETTPGHRRDNIDPSPNPTSILFMLRHKSYSIQGQVRLDDGDGNMYEADGVTLDAGDTRLANSTSVRIRTLDPDGSDWSGDSLSATGYYRLPDPTNTPPSQRFYVYGRTYEVELVENTLPVGYGVIANTAGETGPGSNTMDVTIDQCTSGNEGSVNGKHFLVARTYSIGGYVFDDLNADGVLNNSEGKKPNLANAISTDLDPATQFNTDGTGNFLISGLPEGQRTISLSWTLPADWETTFPVNPGAFLTPNAQVTLGEGPAPRPVCDITNYTNALSLFNGGAPTSNIACITTTTATQNVGDIRNLSFGVRPTPPEPWTQGIGGDMRSDSGNSLPNFIPDNSPPSVYGINPNPLFSISDGNLEFGIVFGNGLSLGPGASDNYLLANANRRYVNQDFAPNTRDTSYNSMSGNLRKNGATTTDPGATIAGDPGAGNYQHTGIVTIDNGANPISLGGGKYIFLINGDLNINSDIIVPSGSVAIFIASGNITVAENVENIHGLLSTDGSFTVNGNALDLNLNEQLIIQGSVVALGGYNNQRNLDTRNATTPSVLIRFRPDFVINAPTLIRFSDYKISEIAPGESTSQ